MYCLGCGYNLKGLQEPSCPECGRGFDPADERTWSASRHVVLRKSIGRWAGRLLLLHLAGLVVWCGVELVRGEDLLLALFLPYLLSMPLLFGSTGLWLMGIVEREHFWRGRKCSIALGLVCLLLLGSYWLRWPLQLAFVVSRPALNRLVDQAEQGQVPHGPVWAGAFRVELVNQRNGYWSLWIDANSSGPDALVYGLPADNVRNSFNVWSHGQLDENWHIINED